MQLIVRVMIPVLAALQMRYETTSWDRGRISIWVRHDSANWLTTDRVVGEALLLHLGAIVEIASVKDHWLP